jgi:hypothetical protein
VQPWGGTVNRNQLFAPLSTPLHAVSISAEKPDEIGKALGQLAMALQVTF